MGRCGKCKAEVRKQRPWVTLVERLKLTIANSEDEAAHLLLRKGIYPYEHVNSFDLTKPGWSKPHTHSNPTNLALFRYKITLYRFNQGGS